MMRQSTRRTSKRHDPASILLAIGFLAADFTIWWSVGFGGSHPAPARIYFLDVGQGDAELVALSDGVRIITDAGPDSAILRSLAAVVPGDGFGLPYLDMAIISHPERDHFGGYAALLDHYRVGVFIYNGRDAAEGDAGWTSLRAKIKEKGIPLVTVGKGDVIRHKDSEIDVVSPGTGFAQSAATNDAGIVELVKLPGLRALFTADTGMNVEAFMRTEHGDLRAEVLKIPHHGSQYASDAAFLRAVDPKVAVIEVGAKNAYGQPASSTLARIASSTRARILRTDRDGTVAVWAEGSAIHIAGG